MKTIAIDFDGVIHAYGKGWQNGEIYDDPIEGSFKTIKKLMKDGYAVYIHSTRKPEQIQEWLKQKKSGFNTLVIPDYFEFFNDNTVLGITNRKLPAIAYIDDRAVKFNGDWKEIAVLPFETM